MNANNFFGTSGPIKDLDQNTWQDQIKMVGKTTLDASLIELKNDFVLTRIYRVLPSGKIVFNHEFVDKFFVWMWTDSVVAMSQDERAFLDRFIKYEDYKSNSALTTDLGGAAIGASTSGFVVDANYNKTTIMAQGPDQTEVFKKIYEEFDKVLISIYDGTYVPHTF